MKKIQSFCFKTPPTAAGFNAQPKTKNNEKKITGILYCKRNKKYMDDNDEKLWDAHRGLLIEKICKFFPL